MASSKELVLFDFDGTLTSSDSLLDFTFQNVGPWRFILGAALLSPVLVFLKTGFIPGEKAKETFLTFFFKGWSEEALIRAGEKYSHERIPRILWRKAAEEIRRHKAEGRQIAIVTASPEIYLRAWCRKEGLELLGTRIEFKNGKATGKLLGANCSGAEKARRIREKYRVEDFGKIYAYGDSRSDTEMLALAHEKHYKFMRK